MEEHAGAVLYVYAVARLNCFTFSNSLVQAALEIL